MEFYKIVSVVAAIIFLSGCYDDDQTKKEEGLEKPKEEKKDFLPVAEYIKAEIRYVDSLPLGIQKITKENGKSDTEFIRTPEFDELSKEFLPADLDTTIFKKNFSETSFLDQTTKSLTFTYATENKDLELRRVDVLASADGEFNKMKSIYMEKTIHKKDTLILKKLFWRAKKNFQVSTTIEIPNSAPVSKQLNLVWDKD
jgi:hypothetical protein